MGAFLSGLLGAAGEDIEKQSDRAYEEKRQERLDRMRILEAAASNPKFDQNKLSTIFGELDDLAKDAGYKSQQKGLKNPFGQMGKAVQHILTRRQQQQQQQGQQQQARSDVQGAPGPTVQPGQPGQPPQPAQSAQSAQPPQTAPMPPTRFAPPQRFDVFRTREQDEAAGLDLAGREQRQTATIGREESSKDYSLWYQRGKEAGLTNPRDLAEFAATKGQKLPSQSSAGMTKQWVKRPGSDEPELAFVNKNDPSGYIDAEGKGIPGAVPVATPTQERLYGAVQGYYMFWRGKGLDEKAARAKAGEDFRDNQGKRLSRLEQQAAIDAALSGVGMGQGFTSQRPTPSGTQPPAGQPPTAASPTNVSRGTLSPTPPMPPSRLPSPSRTQSSLPPTTPFNMNPRDRDDVQFYLNSLMTKTPVSRPAQVRVQNGQRALAKMTGLDPMSMSAELAELPALAKQLGETIQRAGAIQRLNNTINQHGAILEGVAANVAQTDSPFLNKPVREWKRKAVGSEELRRFQIALNALQREYAYLTAGGAQSRAMLPVHTSESMDKILSDDSTLQEVKAAVDQIRIEARTEEQALKKTQEDMKDAMRSNRVGQAVSPPGASAAPATGGGAKRKVWNEQTQSFEDR